VERGRGVVEGRGKHTKGGAETQEVAALTRRVAGPPLMAT
jgi:hypothetical protein